MEARVAIEEQEGVFAVALDVSPVALVDVAVGLQRRDRRAGLHLPGRLAALRMEAVERELSVVAQHVERPVRGMKRGGCQQRHLLRRLTRLAKRA